MCVHFFEESNLKIIKKPPVINFQNISSPNLTKITHGKCKILENFRVKVTDFE